EEVRNKPQIQTAERATVTAEKTETRPRNKKQSKTRETKVTELNKPVSPSPTDISAKPEGHPRRIKTTNRPKKEPEISSKDADSILSKKPSQPYRDQADGAKGLADGTRSSLSLLFRRRCTDRYLRPRTRIELVLENDALG